MLASADDRLSHQDSKSLSDDWAALVMNAGRKRRMLSEALERRSDQRRGATLAAVWAGFGTFGSSLATYFDLAPWTYLVPASIGMALVSGSAALFLVVLDRREARDALTADVARCSLIAKQIQALAQHEAPAPALEAVFKRLLAEFKSIADRHRALDGGDLIAERRHPRVPISHMRVTCTLRNGERWYAAARDLSRSGVALRTDIRLPKGTLVTIGSTPARAARETEDGMAFEFLKPIPRERFSSDMAL